MRKEPFRPRAEENRAGNDVHDIAKRKRHKRAERKRRRGIFNFVAENTAEAQHRERHDIVQQANAKRLPNHHLAVARQEECRNRFCAEQHFQQRIGKAAQQAPFCAVAIGNQYDGEHACEGNCAAERQFQTDELRNQFQDNGDCQQQRTFDQAPRFVVFFHFFRPPNP